MRQFIKILSLLLLVVGCGSEMTKVQEQNNAQNSISNDQTVWSSERNYKVRIHWMDGPHLDLDKTNLLKFSFTDAQGRGVEVDQFKFQIFMKIHGHGGYDHEQVITKVEGAKGEFVGSGFHFSMNGPWEVNIEAVVDGVTLRFEVPVSV